jgi:hypothetical protein
MPKVDSPFRRVTGKHSWRHPAANWSSPRTRIAACCFTPLWPGSRFATRCWQLPELRQFAQFEKQVWLVGQGSHFEIWSDAGWQKQQDVFFAMGDQQLPPGLEDLAL